MKDNNNTKTLVGKLCESVMETAEEKFERAKSIVSGLKAGKDPLSNIS